MSSDWTGRPAPFTGCFLNPDLQSNDVATLFQLLGVKAALLLFSVLNSNVVLALKTFGFSLWGKEWKEKLP